MGAAGGRPGRFTRGVARSERQLGADVAGDLEGCGGGRGRGVQHVHLPVGPLHDEVVGQRPVPFDGLRPDTRGCRTEVRLLDPGNQPGQAAREERAGE